MCALLPSPSGTDDCIHVALLSLVSYSHPSRVNFFCSNDPFSIFGDSNFRSRFQPFLFWFHLIKHKMKKERQFYSDWSCSFSFFILLIWWHTANITQAAITYYYCTDKWTRACPRSCSWIFRNHRNPCNGQWDFNSSKHREQTLTTNKCESWVRLGVLPAPVAPWAPLSHIHSYPQLPISTLIPNLSSSPHLQASIQICYASPPPHP
jgi:hypothetical protein